MSTCPNKELFSAYIDDEVGSPWKEMITSHLQDCSECRRIYMQYQSLHLAFQKDAAMHAASFDCAGSFAVLAEKRAGVLEQYPRKRYAFHSAKKVISFAAAAAVLVVCTPLLFQLKNNRQSVSGNDTFEPFLPVSHTRQLNNMLHSGLRSSDMNALAFSAGSLARKSKVFMVNDFAGLYSCGGFSRTPLEVPVKKTSRHFPPAAVRRNSFFSDIPNEQLKISLADVAFLYNVQLKRMNADDVLTGER